MDGTAFALCRDNGIPIVVFNFFRHEELARVVRGDLAAATYVGNCRTELADTPTGNSSP
jgi:uridylate kinase